MSCGEINQVSTSAGPSSESSHPSIAHLDSEQQQWVERTLSNLTIQEMTGQVIMAWVPGNYISTDSDEFDKVAQKVERGMGGLWLMGGLPHARAAKLNALQDYAKVPMFVMGDGLGFQLYSALRDRWMLGGGTDIPPQMAFGAIGDPNAVYEVARIAGIEARTTGSNLLNDTGGNVLSNLENVLYNWCYGDDAEQAGHLVAAFVKGVHDAGVICYMGFFPGAGSLRADPHVELPITRNNRKHFENIDFVPFRSAIKSGLDMVMTSHFAVPGLTGLDSLPATLSPEVIRILREELDFNGLIITDDLSMGGISNTYQNVDAAIASFKAGHDLLLGVFEVQVADKLMELIESGEIPLERLRASVRRILEAKARLGLHKNRRVSLESIDAVVGNRTHQQTADLAAERSITLLRDRQKLVPISSPADLKILSVTLERSDNEEAGHAFNAVLRQHVRSVKPVRIFPDSEVSMYEQLNQQATNVDEVVISVYFRPQLYDGSIDLPDAFVEFVNQLQREGRKVILISFGKLNVLDKLPDLSTFMLGWSEQAVMQKAAARALLGLSPIEGRLPVGLPPFHKTGEGLSRAK